MSIKVHITYYMQIDGTTRVAVRKIEENGIDEVEIEDENGEMHRVWQKGSGMDINERCPLEKGLEGECGLRDALDALVKWYDSRSEGFRKRCSNVPWALARVSLRLCVSGEILKMQ